MTLHLGSHSFSSSNYQDKFEVLMFNSRTLVPFFVSKCNLYNLLSFDVRFVTQIPLYLYEFALFHDFLREVRNLREVLAVFGHRRVRDCPWRNIDIYSAYCVAL